MQLKTFSLPDVNNYRISCLSFNLSEIVGNLGKTHMHSYGDSQAKYYSVVDDNIVDIIYVKF